MFTRKMFMHAYTYGDREACHAMYRKYYAQPVTASIKGIVLRHIGLDALLASKDPSLNDIPLEQWDSLYDLIRAHTPRSLLIELTGHSDMSLLEAVCIAKEAARQLIEENSPDAL